MKKRSVFSTCVILLVALYLFLPLAVTFIYSVFTDWMSLLPTGFTLRNYQQLLSEPRFYLAMGRTLVLCVTPIFITIFCMLMALYTVLVYFPSLEKYLQFLCMIPHTIQGVILSVSILSLFSSLPGFLSNRLLMLHGAYCVVILPYVFQSLSNNIHTINMPMLLNAAEILGAGKLYAFFHIVLPNLKSGILTAALLSMSVIFGDYVLIRNIAGGSFENIQLYLFQTMDSSASKASAIFVFIFAVTFTIAFITLFLKSSGADSTAKNEVS